MAVSYPKLDSQEHLNNPESKVTIALLRKHQKMTKLFIKSHLDYRDIIYDQAYNNSSYQKLEAVQYNSKINSAWNPLKTKAVVQEALLAA